MLHIKTDFSLVFFLPTASTKCNNEEQNCVLESSLVKIMPLNFELKLLIHTGDCQCVLCFDFNFFQFLLVKSSAIFTAIIHVTTCTCTWKKFTTLVIFENTNSSIVVFKVIAEMFFKCFFCLDLRAII